MYKKISVVVFLAFILLSFPIKFLHYDDPYFGAYLSRQLQTMSTIDAYMQEGVNLIKPRTNYAGYPGYMVYEFPIFQAVCAWLSNAMPNADPLFVTKTLNLIFSTLSIVLVYFIAARWFNPITAFYSAVFFSLTPLNLMFHQSTLIDIPCIFFILLANLALLYWNDKSFILIAIFALSAALGVLIKPLYLLPVVILFLWRFWRDISPFNSKTFVKAVKKHALLLSCFGIATILLGVWIIISKNSSTVSDGGILHHFGWSELLSFNYYFKIMTRVIKQFINPFNLSLFLVGALWLWQNKRNQEQILLLWIPILYYILFPLMNQAHAYYSLILIPYFSIITGCGAARVEELLFQKKSEKCVIVTRIVILGTSFIVSLFMYMSTMMISMVLPSQRYAQMTEELRHILEPIQYSIVYVNKDGNFPIWEHLRNNPTNYLKSFLTDIPEKNFKFPHLDTPLVHSATLYALKQYGRVRYVPEYSEINYSKDWTDFNKELRYILFYVFSNRKNIIKQMSPLKPIYESRDWVVFDLKHLNI